MKFINFKISHECVFPLENIAHVSLCKFFIISVQTFKPRISIGFKAEATVD